jgi:hypothetical protein
MQIQIVMARTLSATLAVGSWGSPATTRRSMMSDIIFGAAEATPGDFGFVWEVQACTTQGTNTAITLTAANPADGTPTITAGQNHTVTPTLTANQVRLSIGLNQRSTYRWVAPPGSELYTPATSANGLAVETPTAGALVSGRAVATVFEL